MGETMTVFQILEKFGNDAYLTASITKPGDYAYIPAGNNYEYKITRKGKPINWEYEVFFMPRRALLPKSV